MLPDELKILGKLGYTFFVRQSESGEEWIGATPDMLEAAKHLFGDCAPSDIACTAENRAAIEAMAQIIRERET